MRRNLLIIILILFNISILFAKDIKIDGTAIDSVDKTPLINASVVLTGINNESRYFTSTDKNGYFAFKDVNNGNYNLKLTYISYKPYEKKITVSGKNIELGKLFIQRSEVKTEEVEVTAQAPIGEQKEDTTEYNTSAFKTQPDATAEDLVKKLPGVQVESGGNVKAQGEDVKKVLVDGKPFFGDDPSMALKNLPADIVDRIQIFDRMSDWSEFSGFDDGNTSKAMNIITKRLKGQFGKVSGGYGYQDKYIGTLNYNMFSGPQRISILGLTNNVNQQNFAFMDILEMMGVSGQRAQFFNRGAQMFGQPGGGGGMRMPFMRGLREAGGGGTSPADFFVGQLDGVTTTHAIGGNYTDSWSDQTDISGSYFFNYTKNNNEQNITRDYILSQDSTMGYQQDNLSNSGNYNHRINMKFDWRIDTSNTIMIRPAVSFQDNSTGSYLNSSYFLSNNGMMLNNTLTNYSSAYNGSNWSTEVNYRYRFPLQGRSISFSFSPSYNSKTGSGTQTSYSTIFGLNNQNVVDSLNLITKTPFTGYGLSGSVVYVEPFGNDVRVQFNYNISYNQNNSDKEALNYDYAGKQYSILDTTLSNTYENTYLTHKAGIGLRLRGDDYNLTATINYQRAFLDGEQIFPAPNLVKQNFDNIMPSIRFSYKFSQQTNLNLFYRTNTSIPSIQQLQNVVDNSNPTQLSMGNPGLKQQFSHSIVNRITSFSPDYSNVFVSFLMFNYRTDYIANSTIIASKDTTIQGGLSLPAGGQITKPINMDEFMSFTAFFTFGFPLTFIQSNLNINLGGTYSKTPSLINNVKNFSNAYSTNLIFVLSSNISEFLDFNLSSRVNFNITKNSIRSENNNNYNSFQNSLSLKWIFWEGFFLQSEVRNQFYTGLVQQNNNNYTLLNLSIGKKVLENNAGEIKLSIFDALKQNKSIQTNITDYYVEYSQNRILPQYIMLTFTYNMKSFKM